MGTQNHIRQMYFGGAALESGLEALERLDGPHDMRKGSAPPDGIIVLSCAGQRKGHDIQTLIHSPVQCVRGELIAIAGASSQHSFGFNLSQHVPELGM